MSLTDITYQSESFFDVVVRGECSFAPPVQPLLGGLFGRQPFGFEVPELRFDADQLRDSGRVITIGHRAAIALAFGVPLVERHNPVAQEVAGRFVPRESVA